MAEPKSTELASSTKELPAISQRFAEKVERQFSAELGEGVKWSPLEKRLAQHLFIKIDYALKAFEADRSGDKATFTWDNVNMEKLALDAVHRVSLGLDALIPNHVHPIAYWNSKLRLYDIDLRVGFAGEDYCKRKLAVEPPVDITYHLVHETDEFEAHMKGFGVDIESYSFKVPKPFDRGDVVGGFGYISYEDPKKNRLILVTKRDFDRAKAAAATSKFWNAHPHEMMMKTVVHRVTQKIALDPEKLNSSSWSQIEAGELEYIEAQVAETASLNANSEQLTVESQAVAQVPIDTTSSEAEEVPAAEAEIEAPVEETKAGPNW